MKKKILTVWIIEEFLKGKYYNMAYVYRHIRLDKNVPFYIGISGEDDYNRAHRTRRNTLWKRIANKTKYEVEIIMEGLTWGQACEKEKELIKLYGRVDLETGTLANLTDGGEGVENISPMSKQKISEKNKGKPSWIKGKKDPAAALKRTGVNHTTYQGEVCCYNPKLELIHTFPCLRDAATFFSSPRTNEIVRVIKGERRLHKGHIFKYKHDLNWRDLPEYKEPIIPLENKPKKVINSDTGEVFENMLLAAKAYGIPHRNLARYMNGTRKNVTPFREFVI